MPQDSSELLPESTLRKRNGETKQRRLPAWKHRQLHLTALHAQNPTLVELVAGIRPAPDEKVRIFTRKWSNHFHKAGASGRERWLDPLLAQAERHHQRGHEVFLGPADRARPSALKWHTETTRFLWLDVDDATQLPKVWEFLNQPAPGLPNGRQPSLVVNSGRGAHFYFPLSEPLPALEVTTPDGQVIRNPGVSGWRGRHPEGFFDPQTGEIIDPGSEAAELIERYNLRLAHAIGHRQNDHGRQIACVADEAVAKRSQPMRLAGTINGRVEQFAYVVLADASIAGYDIHALAGALADPPDRPRTRSLQRLRSGGEPYTGPDPFKRLDLREVYQRLTGNEITFDGDARCPNPEHEDRNPSCDVGVSLINCWVCEFGGDVYNLIAALSGGPIGRTMTKQEFLAVKRRAVELFGDLDKQARAERRAASTGPPPPADSPPPPASAPVSSRERKPLASTPAS